MRWRPEPTGRRELSKHARLHKNSAYALAIAPTQGSEHIGALLRAGLCSEEKCPDNRRHAHYLVTKEGKLQLENWLQREMVLIPAHYQSDHREPLERVEYAINSLNQEIGDLLKTHHLLDE